ASTRPSEIDRVRANTGSGPLLRVASPPVLKLTKPGREKESRQSGARTDNSCLSATSAPGWQVKKTNVLGLADIGGVITRGNAGRRGDAYSTHPVGGVVWGNDRRAVSLRWPVSRGCRPARTVSPPPSQTAPSPCGHFP